MQDTTKGEIVSETHATTQSFLKFNLIHRQTGVYVHGLYLEGGSWNLKKGVLAEAANKVLYKMMPAINIFAVNATVPLAPTMYECPVYKIVKRTNLNFITSLRLKSDKPS